MIPTITKYLEKTCCENRFLNRFFDFYYSKIVENEVKLGNISSEDKVLCIGGGPMPCTAAQITRRSGCSITVIDNDEDAASMANRYIKSMSLEDKIQVKVCSGEDISLDDYSVIHIALQVHPKEKVFSHVWKNCSVGTRILMREPKKTLESCYCKLHDSMNYGKRYETIKQGGTMKETSLFVKGREGRNLEKDNNVLIWGDIASYSSQPS